MLKRDLLYDLLPRGAPNSKDDRRNQPSPPVRPGTPTPQINRVMTSTGKISPSRTEVLLKDSDVYKQQ